MFKQITTLVAAIGILGLPAQAQSTNGSQYYTTAPTGLQAGQIAPSNAGVTGPFLLPATTGLFGLAPGSTTLPTTEFSSLIFNPAGVDDEGTNGLPPDNGYGPQYSLGGPGESMIPSGLSTGHYDPSLPAVSSDAQYMLPSTLPSGNTLPATTSYPGLINTTGSPVGSVFSGASNPAGFGVPGIPGSGAIPGAPIPAGVTPIAPPPTGSSGF